jgi:DNA ligase-1
MVYIVLLLWFLKLRWMTEKYDGMRLFWDGSAFYSRQGKKMKVPEVITSQMPKIALDGELW